MFFNFTHFRMCVLRMWPPPGLFPLCNRRTQKLFSFLNMSALCSPAPQACCTTCPCRAHTPPGFSFQKWVASLLIPPTGRSPPLGQGHCLPRFANHHKYTAPPVPRQCPACGWHLGNAWRRKLSCCLAHGTGLSISS